MALLDYQFSLGGVVFGAGTVYYLSGVSGFGLGDKRAKVFENPGADGVQWGREYRGGPTITFAGQVVTDGDDAAAYTAIKTLRGAFDAGTTRRGTKTTQTLGAKLPGQTEAAITGRADRFDADLGRLRLGVVTFSATFIADAPLSV